MIFNEPDTQGGTTGYTYNIRAIDPDGDALTYRFVESPPEGMTIDSETGEVRWDNPVVGVYPIEIEVIDGRGGVDRREFDLEIRPGVGAISGEIWQDLNEDGVWDDGEEAWSNIEVFLDLDRDSQLDENEPTTYTDLSGNYRFDNLTPGNYKVCANFPDGTVFSYPATKDPILGQENLVRNGSFESIHRPPSNYSWRVFYPSRPSNGHFSYWGMTGHSVEADGYRVWSPSHGLYSVDLNGYGPGGVYQDIVTEPGQRYQVNFHLGGHAISGSNKTFYTVAYAGNVSQTFSSIGSGNRNPRYQARSLEFEATDTSTRIHIYSISNTGGAGPVLDHVRVHRIMGYKPFHEVSVVAEQVTEDTNFAGLLPISLPANQFPKIKTEPPDGLDSDGIYRYDVDAEDLDRDPLTYQLIDPPAGMAIDSQTGQIFWKPTLAQRQARNNYYNPLGIYDVLVQVLDGRGGTDLQVFQADMSLQEQVQGGIADGLQFEFNPNPDNRVPQIYSKPPEIAVVGQEYRYSVDAIDPDGDTLLYEIDVEGIDPVAGMEFDPNTRSIVWTPTVEQVGQQTTIVRVTDTTGAFARQVLDIDVRGINTPPQITSDPITTAILNTEYRYFINGSDVDGDGFTFSLLPGAPEGMEINSETGEINWIPSELGEYEVGVLLTDEFNSTSTQTYTLQVRDPSDNQYPLIESIPQERAFLGREYLYQIVASDPDGDSLTYVLQSAPFGVELNSDTGELTWTPFTVDGERYEIEVAVVDPSGYGNIQRFFVETIDNPFPEIDSEPNLKAALGVEYVYDVVASDPRNDRLSYQLIDPPSGASIDEFGRLTWTPDTEGIYPIQILVTDELGGATPQTFDLEVLTDTEPPTIINPTDLRFAYTNELTTFVVEAEDNIGVVSRSLRLNGQPLELDDSATATHTFTTVGDYTVEVTATDASGNTTEETYTYIVLDGSDRGDFGNPNDDLLELGKFTLSFTDLAIPLSGIPIQVTRSYDTFNTDQQDNFGYGWRLEFRDTDLRTNAQPDRTNELLGVPTVAFREGQQVYLTEPGGRKVTFEFRVRPDGRLFNNFLGFGGQDLRIFYPEFVPVTPGVTSTLSVDSSNVRLQRLPDGRYTLWGTGVPYNPANFGNHIYTLSMTDGITYTIDGFSGDLLTASDTNGNVLSYSDSGIVSNSGKRVDFVRDGAGRIATVIDPEGEEIDYGYDGNGDLISVTDREENTTTFEYYQDAFPHYLEEIIDPLGRTGMRTEYDEEGRLKTVFDANGETVEFVYNPDEYIQQVFDPFSNPTTYLYDDRGNVLLEVDPTNQQTRYKYEDSRNPNSETEVTVVTNEDGVEQQRTTKYTYDAGGNVLTETDAEGNVTRFTYGNFDRLTGEIDPLGNTTTYTYDGRGNLLSTKDAEGNVTTFSYDGRGNLRFLTDASGNGTEFRYDGSGNVEWVKDADGNITEYEYDPNGNREKETQSVTTPSGVKTVVTQWKYDREGELEYIIDPENNRTDYDYDANGNQISVTDSRGYETQSVYDAKNRLVETIFPDDTPGDLSDNPRTITVYDRGDRRRASIDENGRVTHFVYDEIGRMVETIYPTDGDSLEQFLSVVAPGETVESVDWTQVVYPDTLPGYLSDRPRMRTEYLKTGEVKAEIDERGNRTEYRYDAEGQLIETIYADDTPGDLSDNPRMSSVYDDAGRQVSQTDANNYTTTFVYDKLGRLEETLFPDGTSTKTEYDELGRRVAAIDPLENRTQYEYDKLGRLTDVVQFLEGREIRTEYGYDELGRQIFQEDANDNRTTFEYDLSGRRMALVLPLGQRSTMVYDGVGNIVSETDFNGEVTTYTYDPRNRLVEIDLPNDPDVSYTYTLTGQMETVTDGRGVTSYVYDVRDRLVGRTDPTGPYTGDGFTIEYEYDLASNRTGVETPGGLTSYSFDERNRLETVADSSQGVTIYQYDGVNNLIETILPNGVVETREYDELNRLELLEQSLDGTVVASYDYKLDDAGNRVEIKETIRQSSGELIERVVEYDYDDLYRLVEEQFDGRTIAYTYDNVGNRLTKVDSVTGEITYRYDPNDLLIDETHNGVVTSFSYDNNGNTTSRTRGTEETIYIWDDRDRLIGVQTPGNENIEYVYDENNIRVGSIVDSETTTYLVDRNRPYAQVLEEYVDSSLTASYVYGLDLISQERGSDRSFYLVDGLGSTKGLMDENGEVTDTYIYDAFGNLITSDGSTANSYLFTGEQFDSNLEQYYLRQRFYDANVGQFTRRDFFEGFNENPITLHKYLYANANPANFIDPTGLFSIGEILTPFTVKFALGASALAYVGTGLFQDHFFRSNSADSDGVGGIGREVFDNSDDAAIAVLQLANPLSIRDDKEYAGRICKSLFNGQYFYTAPFPGTEDAASPGFCPFASLPSGYYHTHGQRDTENEFHPGEFSELVSQDDINVLKFLLPFPGNKIGYVATPTGLIKRFTTESKVAGQEGVDIIGTTNTTG